MSDTSVKWFGESWGAPICAPEEKRDTPVGSLCCCGCGRAIQEGDQGLLLWTLGAKPHEVGYGAWLYDCFWHSIDPMRELAFRAGLQVQ